MGLGTRPEISPDEGKNKLIAGTVVWAFTQQECRWETAAVTEKLIRGRDHKRENSGDTVN